MIVLKEKLRLSPADNQSHMRLPFKIQKKSEKLIINYSYQPKELTDETKARELVIEGINYCFPKKDITQEEIEKALPIKNLITISLDSPLAHLGAAHRHANSQEHVITEKKASRGFFPSKIVEGEWCIILSCHYIASDNVTVNLEVKVE